MDDQMLLSGLDPFKRNVHAVGFQQFRRPKDPVLREAPVLRTGVHKIRGSKKEALHLLKPRPFLEARLLRYSRWVCTLEVQLLNGGKRHCKQ
eukprot:3659151-Pleurochrysis_carterae.AAC.1